MVKALKLVITLLRFIPGSATICLSLNPSVTQFPIWFFWLGFFQSLGIFVSRARKIYQPSHTTAECGLYYMVAFECPRD